MNTNEVYPKGKGKMNSSEKINTWFVYPPIPVRHMDWIAIFDSYDGAEASNCPVGTGETEAEAIEDLLEQCE